MRKIQKIKQVYGVLATSSLLAFSLALGFPSQAFAIPDRPFIDGKTAAAIADPFSIEQLLAENPDLTEEELLNYLEGAILADTSAPRPPPVCDTVFELSDLGFTPGGVGYAPDAAIAPTLPDPQNGVKAEEAALKECQETRDRLSASLASGLRAAIARCNIAKCSLETSPFNFEPCKVKTAKISQKINGANTCQLYELKKGQGGALTTSPIGQPFVCQGGSEEWRAFWNFEIGSAKISCK